MNGYNGYNGSIEYNDYAGFKSSTVTPYQSHPHQIGALPPIGPELANIFSNIKISEVLITMGLLAIAAIVLQGIGNYLKESNEVGL